MINRVGILSGISKFVPNFKSENKEDAKVSYPEIKAENKGLEALAAYNEAIVKKEISKENFDINPIPLIMDFPADIDKMEGEKIYTSDGKLHSIIRRDENTYTVFTPDANTPDKFSIIETFSKDSAKYPIKVQKYEQFGNTPYIYIDEFNPVTGENIGSTSYYDGNLERISKTYNSPDGKTIDVSYDYDDKNYFVNITYKNNKNRVISANFNDDKQLLNASEYKMNSTTKLETSVDFYSGIPYRITKFKEYIIPNQLGKELTNDLKPGEYFNKIENLKDIEGEKTYYSNGALETNTFDSDAGKTTAHFLPDGSCDRINSDKKELIFEKESETINEILPDGKTKKTSWYKDGGYSVKISDDKTYREAYFSANRIPNDYEEGIIEDGKEKENKWLSFNDEGMLDCC